MKPIIIFGTMGSGKDTLAEMITQKMFSAKIYKLGEDIRKIVDKACPDEINKRPKYQEYGQMVRHTLGIDAWNNICLDKITFDKAKDIYITPIIADGRQINEYYYWEEHGFYAIGIEAPLEVRYDRLVKRDGQCDEERMYHDTELQAQFVVTQLADRIIVNNADLKYLEFQAEQIINELYNDKVISLIA